MRYAIRLRGHLDARWLDGDTQTLLVHMPDGETVLTTGDLDQAALHGLLARIRDIGAPLLAVTPDDARDGVPCAAKRTD